MNRKWAVLLDRDGTLVANAHYPTKPGQLRPYAAFGSALRALSRSGARFAVVSNQAAIARGYLDAKGLRVLDHHLHGLFRRERVRLEKAFYCPHHPDFTGACRCRKPNPGMLEDALRRLRAAADTSYMVGDTAADMEAGRRLGLRTVLVLTGHGRRDREQVLDSNLADKVTQGLKGASAWILEDRRERHGV